MAMISETELPNSPLIFLHQSRVRSQIIYVTVVVAIFAALAALLFYTPQLALQVLVM